MFGSGGSPPKAVDTSVDSPLSPTDSVKSPVLPIPESDAPDKAVADDAATAADRKRRSSGIAKARDMFSSAKNSFVVSPTRGADKTPQSPIQKLGKVDPALSVPHGAQNNAAGESHPTARSTFRVGVTEDKNKKCRRTMEDTHAYLYNFLSTPAPVLAKDGESRSSLQSNNTLSLVSSQAVVETDNGYFAIFDGHAGTFAAEWCGKKLHLLLEESIRKNPNRPIPELMDETFTNVDSQLEKLPLKNSGCTAVIAVLRWEDRIPNSTSATGSTSIAPAAAAAVAGGGENAAAADANETKLKQLSSAASRSRVLYTANVGDARIVLCRNGKALRLSYDHKGSDDNEGKRIANAGGLILNNRVNGVLAVTRALGDSYMKDLVTGHPYTTETVIQPEMDEFLILACDGLWDVCSDQEAVDLIRNQQEPQAASKMLVDHALSRFSTDNLSCMVVRFNKTAIQDAVEARAEPIGVDGDPSSLKGGVSEADAIVNAAKKGINVDSPNASGDLEQITNELIVEEEAQELGPELDPDGLAKAREKATEGQDMTSVKPDAGASS